MKFRSPDINNFLISVNPDVKIYDVIRDIAAY